MAKNKYGFWDKLTWALVVTGSINWLLQAMNWNIVTKLAPGSWVNPIYWIIGLSGIYVLLRKIKVLK